MNTLTVRVDGEPKAQPRPRAFSRGGHARVYDPGTAEGWKSLIAEAMRPNVPHEPITGPVEVSLVFEFSRPKAHFRTGKHSAELRPDAPEYHTAKPDRDNLDKAVLDVLTTLGVLKDDSQVCTGIISKRYGARPGATIRVRRIERVEF